ncbi:hypothetical protein [Prochlorothrix hollandica]|uniref:Uncharacterized protein n=1 Tax=Prochlorothrix hollandica PCC 9006 = CALU 1027 TaxID=317619 RepID=A0A0M2PXQ8_PROHO|nr:hypothetical protein [Prochlorothrix hollandica]KKJ00955.1 hypothetical protein PROH_00480 [Prochlorothrix hollandica PCC 9006 = CALU 1027]
MRDDRSNPVDKFNRLIRAVFQFLHQDLGAPSSQNPKPMEPTDGEDWTKETTETINRSLLDR